MLIPFDQLFQRHGIKPSGVLHVGAHYGEEAEAYNQQGIPQVIWVEALPEAYWKLTQHVGGMPGHQCLLACVGDKDGRFVNFHVASNEGQSSSILEFGTHLKEHPTVCFVKTIKVTTTRLDTLLAQSNIQFLPGAFLNLDLQGAELMALRGLGRLIEQFHWAYIEVNDQELYRGCPLTPEIDAWMKGAGFRPLETKMTNFGWGDKLYGRI